eukprot:TRINITY_DN1483_c0_g1_i4.p1 TRINITY_DN1483_c0_g1~~TRINITY_DN1483_c0_g1_i4.p1  ORF type:complete len:446 (+),score=58.58 TRINITY_DN1483_c0_g1_i4:216-1553(+)
MVQMPWREPRGLCPQAVRAGPRPVMLQAIPCAMVLIRLRSGLVAAEELQEGDVLCSIPFHLAVSTRMAERSLGDGFEFPAGLQLQKEVLLLSLFLIRERVRPDSEWTAWLDSLPTLESFSCTFSWNDAELDALDASQLRADTMARRKKVSQDFELLAPIVAQQPWSSDDGCWSSDLFAWALHNVWSRSFYLPLPQGATGFGDLAQDEDAEQHTCLMLPYCDFINHTNQPTGFKVDFDSERIMLCATQEYKPGDQVFDCYGPKSNAILLLNYGFALSDNEHDAVILCVKQPPCGDEDQDLSVVKQRLLTGHHLDSSLHVPIRLKQLLPPDLLAFMRIAHLETASQALDDGKLRSAAKPYSLTNESRALKSLLRLAQGHLSQNATTQREDEELLADVGKEMPNNVRSAIILRHGEKRILNQFCAALKERMRQTIMFFSMNAQRNSSG